MNGSETARLAVRTVERLLPQWAEEAEIKLDLDALNAIDRSAAGLLACALAGSLSDRPLEVTTSATARLDWLDASGLAFAVAHRDGPTQVHAQQLDAGWRRDWSPGFGSPWRTETPHPSPGSLFAPELVGETAVRPDLVGPGFAAFINPHLTRRRTSRSPVATVLWPWLAQIVGHPGRRRWAGDRDRADSFVADVGSLVDEVVSNVGDHATSEGPILSLVQVSLTRGGTGSHDRLNIVVTDTGPGVPVTARRHLGPSELRWSDRELVLALVEGRAGHWGRGRGQGLPRVRTLVRRHDGVLRVSTRTVRLVEDSGQRTVAGDGFDLHGTVVALTFPLA